MARSVRLRAWQKTALERFVAAGHSEQSNFLAVATPGAGKTTFALTAACQFLAENPAARLIVVVPTQHLKVQWAQAAAGFGLHLEPEWAAANGRLPRDMHGIVTTYQQVATTASVLAGLCHQAFVILDEVHHAGDDRAWGDGLRLAFTPAARRLSLSGTPFRSDTNAIPFVRYEYDEAVSDYEYGYADALAERGVVRPVYFPRINGHMEWTAPDGSYNEAGFDDELDASRAGQRLRTALALNGEWLPAVLRQAHQQLLDIRRTQSNAGGLIIAMDRDHARGISKLLRDRFNVSSTVATSDDPMASARISHFSASDDPWIVAVRMVSEGVDIPRLRVGVFATNTMTDLFFRQAIGRLVRYVRGAGRQRAYMYIPDDPRLRLKAAGIAQSRRHSLFKREREDGENDDDLRETMTALEDQGPDLPQSQFTPISSIALGDDEPFDDPFYDDEGADDKGVADGAEPDDDGLIIDLNPPPLAGGEITTGNDSGMSRAQQKSELRKHNSACARDIAQLTGMTHKAVNGELNRLASITKISEATARQLEQRLKYAERWIFRLTHGSTGSGSGIGAARR